MIFFPYFLNDSKSSCAFKQTVRSQERPRLKVLTNSSLSMVRNITRSVMLRRSCQWSQSCHRHKHRNPCLGDTTHAFVHDTIFPRASHCWTLEEYRAAHVHQRSRIWFHWPELPFYRVRIWKSSSIRLQTLFPQKWSNFELSDGPAGGYVWCQFLPPRQQQKVQEESTRQEKTWNKKIGQKMVNSKCHLVFCTFCFPHMEHEMLSL